MTVRKALPNDFETLCSLARRFIEETSLPVTYSDAETRHTLWTAIHDEHAIFLVWEGNDVLGGAILGFVDRDFCDQAFSYVQKFYVERELRSLGVAQELIQAFEKEVKKANASFIFSSSTAGMGKVNENLYVHLFERQGYDVLGRVLVKEV